MGAAARVINFFDKIKRNNLTTSGRPCTVALSAKNKLTTTTMSKIKTSLHKFFDTLNEDLHPTLAIGLAEKINKHCNGKLKLTASDIYKEYEAWQNA